jgi:hypothetical protein
MSEKPLVDGPWTISPMSGSDRALATAAARRAGLTIGEWLGEAIRAKVAAEREANAMPAGEIMPPQGQRLMVVEPQPEPPLSIAELGQALALAEKVAELRGQPIRPRSRVLIEINRRMLGHISRSERQSARQSEHQSEHQSERSEFESEPGR